MGFPVDGILGDLVSVLEQNRTVVLQAPPGAGKTTRVPPALLGATYLKGQKLIMLEPRRLAAVNAARWMALQRNEGVGDVVGYRIRHEQKISPATRIEVVTEGILTRRLQTDPLLDGVGLVIFDEFHERSLHADLAMTLCRDVQTGLREDLRILVMSATLDAEPLARALGNSAIVACEGKTFPVDLRYLPGDEDAGIAETTARGIVRAVRETTGDILAFLPGAPEIRRCQNLLSQEGGDFPIICPLYGDLPFEEQERAIVPGGKRRIVLATNIAETSLTIEGVTVVVDSGWRRQSRFDPSSGMDKLITTRISAASATQRAGRAGRTAPGICYRLWSDFTQQKLLPFDPPEIAISDLAPLALQLANWGVKDPEALAWIDPPPAAAMAEGRNLLVSLGALDCHGAITESGKKMAIMPGHPRIAHLVLTGESKGAGGLACDLAALLSERDILPRHTGSSRAVSDNDMMDRLELLDAFRRGAQLVGSADVVACKIVVRAAAEWRKLVKTANATTLDSVLTGRLLAAAYPDRIGKQREPGSDRYLLSNGKGVALSSRTAVRNAPYVVAIEVEGGDKGEGRIYSAAFISEEHLREDFSRQLEERRVVFWDGDAGRIVARNEERLGALILRSRPIQPEQQEVRQAVLDTLKTGAGISILRWPDVATQLRFRVMLLSRVAPDHEWPNMTDEWLQLHAERWLGPFVENVRSVQDLARVDLLQALKALLPWDLQRKLEEGAPTHIVVPSGSRIAIEYRLDAPPVLSVKLQELFGLAETPSVAWGKIPVVLHLLSPAQRPIQVTQDLQGFWNGAYQEVKKELKGRYPKHPWPDDPWSAVPTRRTKKGAERKG